MLALKVSNGSLIAPITCSDKYSEFFLTSKMLISDVEFKCSNSLGVTCSICDNSFPASSQAKTPFNNTP